MKRRTNFAVNLAIFEERKSLYQALRDMPAKSHYPDRSKPYEPSKSEVLQHIVSLFPAHLPTLAQATHDEQYAEAHRILVCANGGSLAKSGALLFDPETRLWQGINLYVPQPGTAETTS